MICKHKIGKTKKAWACPHTDKLHYSKGKCQNCYLAQYYQDRKERQRKKKLLKKKEKEGKSLIAEKDDEGQSDAD